jgi:hypothetical protein
LVLCFVHPLCMSTRPRFCILLRRLIAPSYLRAVPVSMHEPGVLWNGSCLPSKSWSKRSIRRLIPGALSPIQENIGTSLEESDVGGRGGLSKEPRASDRNVVCGTTHAIAEAPHRDSCNHLQDRNGPPHERCAASWEGALGRRSLVHSSGPRTLGVGAFTAINNAPNE